MEEEEEVKRVMEIVLRVMEEKREGKKLFDPISLSSLRSFIEREEEEGFLSFFFDFF